MSDKIAMLVHQVNSIPRCAVINTASNLLAMHTRARKPLDIWQKEDAARLAKLFESRSKLTQEAFAAEYGLGTQGNVWQYLNGVIPLNLGAAIKFARGLGVRIEEFSPTLAKELNDYVDFSRTSKKQLRGGHRHVGGSSPVSSSARKRASK